MEYNLEHEILLSESEHKSLYSWSLQEFNKEGKQISCDLIPWGWRLYFTTSELRYHHSLEIGKSEEIGAGKDDGPGQIKESISGILHSGTCIDGKSLEDEVIFSMFGTDRRINYFHLNIKKIEKEGDQPKCKMHGFISYTTDLDFETITDDDAVYVEIILTEQQFNTIADLIKTKRIDIMEICLRNVSGFYSDWSPISRTNYIKILIDSKEHTIKNQNDYNIEPLRLGDIGEFGMRIIQRHSLNPKQDLRSINMDKLFEEDDNYEEGNIEKENYQNKESLILSQLIRNEEALKMVRAPIWLIFIILCAILIKFMH